jgi:type VI protein secretion system component VasF
MAMTLLDICEPFLQHVCYLNRLGREGGRLAQVDAPTVEAELESLLAEAKGRAKESRETSAAWNDRVEWALIAFADFAVRTSGLPIASRWQGLGPKRKNLRLDEQFYADLKEELAQTGPESAQRLEIFYQCLGLGFQGMYFGDAQAVERELRPLQRQLAARTGRMVGRGEESDRVCPQAYLHTDQTVLELDTGRWLIPIGIALVVMLVGMVVANVLTYRSSQRELVEQVQSVKASTAAAAQAPAAPAQ